MLIQPSSSLNLLPSNLLSFNPDLNERRMMEFSSLVTVKHSMLNRVIYLLTDYFPCLHFIISMDCLGRLTNGAYWIMNFAPDRQNWWQNLQEGIETKSESTLSWSKRSSCTKRHHCELLETYAPNRHWDTLWVMCFHRIWHIQVVLPGLLTRLQFLGKTVRCWVSWFLGLERMLLLFGLSPAYLIFLFGSCSGNQ